MKPTDGLVTPKIRKIPNGENVPQIEAEESGSKRKLKDFSQNEKTVNEKSKNLKTETVKDKELEIIEIIEEISSIGKKPTNEVEVEAAVQSKSASKKRERPAGPFIGSLKRRKRSVLDDETEAFLSSRMKSLSWKSEEEVETKVDDKDVDKKSPFPSTSEASESPPKSTSNQMSKNNNKSPQEKMKINNSNEKESTRSEIEPSKQLKPTNSTPEKRNPNLSKSVDATKFSELSFISKTPGPLCKKIKKTISDVNVESSLEKLQKSKTEKEKSVKEVEDSMNNTNIEEEEEKIEKRNTRSSSRKIQLEREAEEEPEIDEAQSEEEEEFSFVSVEPTRFKNKKNKIKNSEETEKDSDKRTRSKNPIEKTTNEEKKTSTPKHKEEINKSGQKPKNKFENFGEFFVNEEDFLEVSDLEDDDNNDDDNNDDDFDLEEKKNSNKKRLRKSTTAGVRKYHYSPHTITGKVLSRTLKNLEEPDGVHPCDECPAVFNKSAALKAHVGRNHNLNLNNKCPECPKRLSSRHAIKKHLLSHRPKSEWPFECPLCKQRFQAKGDLPKHFFTSVHKGDKRIPKVGSPKWHNILEQSCIDPDFKTTPRRSSKKMNRTF